MRIITFWIWLSGIIFCVLGSGLGSSFAADRVLNLQSIGHEVSAGEGNNAPILITVLLQDAVTGAPVDHGISSVGSFPAAWSLTLIKAPPGFVSTLNPTGAESTGLTGLAKVRVQPSTGDWVEGEYHYALTVEHADTADTYFGTAQGVLLIEGVVIP